MRLSYLYNVNPYTAKMVPLILTRPPEDIQTTASWSPDALKAVSAKAFGAFYDMTGTLTPHTIKIYQFILKFDWNVSEWLLDKKSMLFQVICNGNRPLSEWVIIQVCEAM